MGYMHIENLYRAPEILQCYALEKVHGTSAHIMFKEGRLTFFSGGVDHRCFCGLYDEFGLHAQFASMFSADQTVTVYGEAFGGKCQAMSETYGKSLRFIVFDVKIDDQWLNVPAAESVANGLGLSFVPYRRGPLSLDFLDKERDADSLVAVVPGKMREGIVIRPITESFLKTGERWIYKHKRDEFKETKTPRQVDPEKAQVYASANAIAEEYVTRMRLNHVLDVVPFTCPQDTGRVVKAMQEDIQREASGEIVWTREAASAVGKATAKLLHKSGVTGAVLQEMA